MLCFARGTAGASPRPFRSPKSAVPIVNPWRTSVSWCLWSKILKIGGFKQPSNLTLSTNILGIEQHTIPQTYDESIPTKRCLRQSFLSWKDELCSRVCFIECTVCYTASKFAYIWKKFRILDTHPEPHSDFVKPSKWQVHRCHNLSSYMQSKSSISRLTLRCVLQEIGSEQVEACKNIFVFNTLYIWYLFNR